MINKVNKQLPEAVGFYQRTFENYVCIMCVDHFSGNIRQIKQDESFPEVCEKCGKRKLVRGGNTKISTDIPCTGKACPICNILRKEPS